MEKSWRLTDGFSAGHRPSVPAPKIRPKWAAAPPASGSLARAEAVSASFPGHHRWSGL
jgi:hypothetical protein